MSEQKPTGDRAQVWRDQLEHALGSPGRSLILGDMDHQSAMLSVRCQEPRHLLHVARMLIDQARDHYDTMEGDDADDMVDLCGELLAMLPEDADAE